jgi:hypothetical protein
MLTQGKNLCSNNRASSNSFCWKWLRGFEPAANLIVAGCLGERCIASLRQFYDKVSIVKGGAKVITIEPATRLESASAV